MSILAAWIPLHPSFTLDPNGFTTHPDYPYGVQANITEFYIRIPENRLILYPSYVQALMSGNSFIAIPIYSTKVGNINSSFSSSSAHGQLPKETIYWLVAKEGFTPEIYTRWTT